MRNIIYGWYDICYYVLEKLHAEEKIPLWRLKRQNNSPWIEGTEGSLQLIVSAVGCQGSPETQNEQEICLHFYLCLYL